MQQALRPYATAGVAIAGASLIAVTPVAAPLVDISGIQSRAVHLTASGFDDVLSAAMANITTLYNNFALAPFVGLQQAVVNLKSDLADIQSGASTPSDVAAEIQANMQKVMAGFTLINPDSGADSSGDADSGSTLDFSSIVSAVTAHTLNNQLDLSGLANGEITIGHSLLLSVLPSLLPTDSGIDPDTVTAILDFLSSPASAMIIGDLGPMISPFVALANDIGDISDALSGSSPDWTTALQDLVNIPASMLGGFLNGADLNLDALAPLIAQAGILPDGTTINSIDFAFGGLLTPGDNIGGACTGGVCTGVDADGNSVDVSPVGGSLFNSLGLDITTTNPITGSGLVDVTVPSGAIGPIGALETWQQTVGALLGDGWDGKSATQEPPIDGGSLPLISPDEPASLAGDGLFNWF